MWTHFDYQIFIWWESGVWWRVYGCTCTLEEDYRSVWKS